MGVDFFIYMYYNLFAMKKLITVACSGKLNISDVETESVEFLTPENIEKQENNLFFSECINKAAGKYLYFIDGDADCDKEVFERFLHDVEKLNADVIAPDIGYVIKTALLKSVKIKNANYGIYATVNALIGAKSVKKINCSPIKLLSSAPLNLESAEEIVEANALFSKNKGKLERSVYLAAYEYVINADTEYYLLSYLNCCKNKNTEEIIYFDKRLKDNIVLYLAVEKRFPVNLKKLRENGFKYSLISVLKINWFLKKSGKIIK